MIWDGKMNVPSKVIESVYLEFDRNEKERLYKIVFLSYSQRSRIHIIR